MKYSDSFMPWKTTNNSKNKNKINTTSPDEALKTDKTSYAQLAISNPDFDPIFSDISNIILSKGTDKDKAFIKNISKKHKRGNLKDEDIYEIETVYDNNYKHLFSSPPDECPSRIITPCILGALFIIGASILRISLDFSEGSSLFIFIAAINFIAAAYTFLYWPSQVLYLLEKWLTKNCVPKSIMSKLMKKVKNTMWIISIVLLLLLIVVFVISFILSIQDVVIDILSIIVLGISILNENIISLIEKIFENNLYHNGHK